MRLKTHICLFFFLSTFAANSQTDSTINLTYNWDSLINKITFTVGTLYDEFDFIDHSPDEEDHKNYRSNYYLINQLPTEKNHKKYFSLAVSLWELEKTAQAEKMFLNIVNSTIFSYTSTFYHNSDIPGDTTTNSYGYGSFTSSYKNYACVYLTKIYIEQKKFAKALVYLDMAVKKYIVVYNCGTGNHWQKREYDFLYAHCYGGLNQNEKVIDLLLPEFLDWNNSLLIKAIKNLYSENEIKKQLEDAERSITCVVDTFQSESYLTHNYGEKNEWKETIRYYAGSGTIKLFMKTIELPYPGLEDGETLTRDYYVKLFRESNFYTSLTGNGE